ncbi:secretogranin-1 isoform X2 [Tachyglossus aculeatus]|uniref:secretogranin-1 isoform X2 n=1 Tax=Tachyglossus aculeatus TaxID=9261 RepID=UPI0018F5E631|nr:secretogranin-1 isoform X2 [Tachyglossus aculeatus]
MLQITRLAQQIVMEGQETTPSYQSEGSSLLDLPSAYDITDRILQTRGAGAISEASSSVENLGSLNSLAEYSNASNPNSEPNDPGTSEDFWLNDSSTAESGKKKEDGLRKSLDRFYETFGQAWFPPGDPLSEAAVRCLDHQITTLASQESKKYALRCFQMARVILNRDGYSVLQRTSKQTLVSPLGGEAVSPDRAKSTPGLSKDVARFLSDQIAMHGGSVAASAEPVDGGDHAEEMVTRCIIEVLSNALAKPNAPPIDPGCREILRKNGKQDIKEKKNENENSKSEARLLREDNGETQGLTDIEEGRNPVDEEATRKMEEEEQEKGGQGRDPSKEEEGRRHQGSHYLHEDLLHKEPEKYQGERSMEEEEEEEVEEKYKKNGSSEEGSQEKRRTEASEEVPQALPDKRFQAKNPDEFLGEFNRHSQSHSKERTHSHEIRDHKSEEEEEEEEEDDKGAEEEEEESISEKQLRDSKSQDSLRHRYSEETDENEEAVAEVAKRRTKPRHHHGRSKFGERRPHYEERRNTLGESEESTEDGTRFWDKRGRHKKNYYEEPEEESNNQEEKRNYHRGPASEDLEEEKHGGRGSEEYSEKRRPSEESQEEEEKRNYRSGESEETRSFYDKIRQRKGEENGGERSHAGEKRHHRGESEDEPEKHDSRDKEKYPSEDQYYVRENNGGDSRRHVRGERRERDGSHFIHKERNREEKQHSAGSFEEEDFGKQRQKEDRESEESREETRFQEKEFNTNRAEKKDKRLGSQFSPYYQNLRWKNRPVEKKDNLDEEFPVSEEERRRGLNEQTYFPEYNDYDWWEKKPLVDRVNQGHGEKRNLPRIPQLGLKRQYNRVDQLAQLLNYRKKSAEFPDFYSSDEEMKKRHVIKNEKGSLNQRPLTEEEEKELENLAAMDLELQKIAEKFSHPRRG